MIRVTVGWLGERGGWHLAFTASRLAAVGCIVRYCPVASLSPFLLYYSKFMVLSMVNKRKLSRETRFPVMHVFKNLCWKKKFIELENLTCLYHRFWNGSESPIPLFPQLLY
jgi:hypothetical protein